MYRLACLLLVSALFVLTGCDMLGVESATAVAARKDPGLRVIDDSYMVIGQACGVPKGRQAAARYLRDFIEEAKASGFVAEALRRSGVSDATVAPAARFGD